MRSLRGVGAPLLKFIAFAVVTLLCTALLAGTIANQVGGDTVAYSAKFTDATGVVKGDEVRIAGVRVGQVNDVRLVDRKVALVDISVQRAVRLPASTQATIKYRNLIGQRFIALDQGAGGPGQPLAEGGTLPLEQTHPAVNLTQLFNGFRPLFQALSPNDVNQLSMELVQVLQGEGGTITSLLAHTASLTSTIADKDKVVGDVIDNLNQVLDTLNGRDAEFTQLVITVRELVSGLSDDRKTIGNAIDGIGELTDATASLLHDARPPLKQDIARLGDLAGNLNDNRQIVEHYFQFLPHKLDALTPLGTYASWFNFFLCDLGGTLVLPPVLGGTEVPLHVPLPFRQRCTDQPNGAAPLLPPLPTVGPITTPGTEPGPAGLIPGLGGNK